MKLLVAFLLVAFALAEGRIVSKCELRDQLVKAISSRKQSELNGVNLVARLVCHAERSSGFNTSTVTELVSLWSHWPHNNDSGNDPVPSASSRASPAPSAKLSAPIKRNRRAVQVNDKFGTLYGVFQLSNRLVCSDGTVPSPTICGVPCSKLIEDDINDDIKCVLNVLTSPDDSFFGDELKRMIRFILEPKCSNVDNSVYFADCPPS